MFSPSGSQPSASDKLSGEIGSDEATAAGGQSFQGAYIPSWRIPSGTAAGGETHPSDVIQAQVRAIASTRGTLGVQPSAHRALLISSTIEGGSKLLGRSEERRVGK